SLIERVPITLEHVHSALDRVNSETPPNGPKNQQFKDSLIWEAALDLATRGTVRLITADGGFFEQRSTANGALATVLRQECNARGADLHIHATIQDCVAPMRENVPPPDYDAMASRIWSQIQPKVDGVAT